MPVFQEIVKLAVSLVSCDMAIVIETDGNELWNAAVADEGGVKDIVHTARYPLDPDDNLRSRVILSKQMSHIPDWATADLPEKDIREREKEGGSACNAGPAAAAIRQCHRRADVHAQDAPSVQCR